MNRMSEKPIYRLLNVISVLTLIYYGATSIHYLIEPDVKLFGPEVKAPLEPPTPQLQARQPEK